MTPAEAVRERKARRHEAIQRRIFGQLARAGVYNAGGSPQAELGAFMRKCIETALPGRGAELKVLDCGCGTGVVLQALRAVLDQRAPGRCRYYGFDLSTDMIAVSRQRLPEVPPTRLQVGSVLDAESYVLAAGEPLFDLVCLQGGGRAAAVDAAVPGCRNHAGACRRGRCGGPVRKERYSRYGLAMGAGKFITRSGHPAGAPLLHRCALSAPCPLSPPG